MTTLQTGIAVVLALVVIAVLFLFPGLSPFGTSAKSQSQTAAAAQTGQSATTSASANLPTTLQVQDEVVGTGAEAKTGDTVTVNYVGALPDGTIFDASANHPETANGLTFTLGAGDVISGWDQGVAGMKVGGKRILVIPPSLAYGSQGVGDVIPPNSTLIFEVELVGVTPAK